MNWLIIVPVIIAVIALIVFIISRNQKDKKELMETLIEQDKVLIPKVPDTEVDTVSEK